jgi:hypothetical protein
MSQYGAKNQFYCTVYGITLESNCEAQIELKYKIDALVI